VNMLRLGTVGAKNPCCEPAASEEVG
jgi:hypothetical protein